MTADFATPASSSVPQLIRGIEGTAQYISEHFFPCTVRYVKEITGTRAGDLPYFKIAGRRHYDPTDIADWVASRRLAPREAEGNSGSRPRP